MKAPKLPKMGKVPKKSASKKVWENFYEKEEKKLTNYNTKKKEFETDKKKVEALAKKTVELRKKRSK